MRATLLVLPALLICGTAEAQRQPVRPPPGERTPIYLTLMGEPIRGVPGGPAPEAGWVAAADLDRSGSISLGEMVQDGARFFKTLDVDKDGVIDGEEITRYETEIAPARVRFAGGLRPMAYGADKRSRRGPEGSDSPSGGGPPGGAPGGGGGRGGSPPGEMGGTAGSFGGGPPNINFLDVPQPILMADANMNRRITEEEFSDAAAKRFAAADLNRNGLLEPTELARNPSKRRRR